MVVSDVSSAVVCPSGLPLNQVAVLVTKGQENVAACDIRLTNEAWNDEVSITVKATTDQLYDGGNSANLTIQSQYKTQNDTATQQLIASMVRLILKVYSDSLLCI